MHDNDDLDEPFGAAASTGVHPLAIIGLIAAILPFFLSLAQSASYTVGDVTTVEYYDPVAVAGGGVAALAGLVLLVTRARRHAFNLIAAVLCLGAGGYHVARGLGLIAAGAAI